jgi:RNA polymerase sigma factor (sigma-70 family)
MIHSNNIEMNNLNVIIKGCAEGNTKQQKVLYECYYGYAFTIALRYMNVADEARLIVNDSFIKFFRSINSFTPSNSIETERQLMGWLKKIVLNTAIDQLRRINKRSADFFQSTYSCCDTDSSLLYKELIRQVKSIPRSYSAVFNMHVIYGFTHFEIASHLGISIGTSKSNLSKAKNYLRKAIKAEAAFSLS